MSLITRYVRFVLGERERQAEQSVKQSSGSMKQIQCTTRVQGRANSLASSSRYAVRGLGGVK